jgi:hypothetical protein
VRELGSTFKAVAEGNFFCYSGKNVAGIPEALLKAIDFVQ